MSESRSHNRGATRFRAGLPCVLHSEDGDFACRAHDLSRSGVLLAGSFPVPCEDNVEVTLRTQTEDLEVRLGGRVARSREDHETEQSEMALAFAEMDGDSQALLEVLVARIMEGGIPPALASLDGNASAVEIREALETVPVPHRIALAARGTPRDREILSQDTNLQVFDALARNPNLNQPEVLRLLRVPVLMPQTLETFARSRWVNVEDVKLLIVTHPSAPLELARRLAATLDPAARTKALLRSGLRGAIRNTLLKK